MKVLIGSGRNSHYPWNARRICGESKLRYKPKTGFLVVFTFGRDHSLIDYLKVDDVQWKSKRREVNEVLFI